MSATWSEVADENATDHAVMRSVEPGETWAWCYPDKLFLAERYVG
jgi:hypothetical protein